MIWVMFPEDRCPQTRKDLACGRYWRRTVRIRPHLPRQDHTLDAEKVLTYILFHLSSYVPPRPHGGTASRLPGVGEATLALVLASKAAQPLKSTWFFRPLRSPAAGFLPPPSRLSAAFPQLTVFLFLQFIMTFATHTNTTERERRCLSLSQIALFGCDH